MIFLHIFLGQQQSGQLNISYMTNYFIVGLSKAGLHRRGLTSSNISSNQNEAKLN